MRVLPSCSRTRTLRAPIPRLPPGAPSRGDLTGPNNGWSLIPVHRKTPSFNIFSCDAEIHPWRAGADGLLLARVTVSKHLVRILVTADSINTLEFTAYALQVGAPMRMHT